MHQSRSTRRATLTLLALLTLLPLTACSALSPTVPATPGAPDPAATSPGSYAVDSACAIGEAGISVLVAGGKAAQALAALVAQVVSDPTIRSLAESVRDGADTEEIRILLGDQLRALCAD